MPMLALKPSDILLLLLGVSKSSLLLSTMNERQMNMSVRLKSVLFAAANERNANILLSNNFRTIVFKLHRCIRVGLFLNSNPNQWLSNLRANIMPRAIVSLDCRINGNGNIGVAQCYSAECLQFPQQLVDLLKNHATTLDRPGG
uniref:NUC130_3NT domain-containing protein n=1 Tax=Glossina austeni TaxID=7395 RepID=A0A1A9UNQ9_GLOAU